MKNNIKPTIVLSTICVVVALLLSAINMVTGPIIEAQRNAAANGALLVVMPDGSGFEELDITSLGLPATVTNAYKETSGKGYVFRVSSTGYKPGMIVMVGVDSEGKITGSKCLETQDTFGKEPQLDNKYNGQTLSDFAPVMISGATMTSNGYRDAVNAALQAFVLASGGKLDPSIELQAIIPTVAPAFGNLETLDATGNIVKAFKAKNGTGFAYVMTEGETSYLVIVNAMGSAKVYDVESNEVTAAHEGLVTEATAHATANQTDYVQALAKKIGQMMTGADVSTEIQLNTFNTVVAAIQIQYEGATYYGFYSRSIGFDQMDVFVILDADGKIVKTSANTLIFHEEFFAGFGGVPNDYLGGYNGFDVETWTGDAAIIAGATMTTNAMKEAVADAFNAFNSIKGGEQ